MITELQERIEQLKSTGDLGGETTNLLAQDFWDDLKDVNRDAITEIIKDVEKGTKLHVQIYRAKSRYRRKIGFRPLHTRLLVQKIG